MIEQFYINYSYEGGSVMNKKKKILAIFLSLTMLFQVNNYYVDVNAASEEQSSAIMDQGTFGDNVTWTLYEDGTLNIDGEGEIVSGINGATSGMDIIEYSSIIPWGKYRNFIYEINISEGITGLGDWLFANYGAILEINFPSTLESIGEGCFIHSHITNKVVLPDNLISLREEAFMYTDVGEVIIPEKINVIEKNLFRASTVKKVTVKSEHIEMIDEYAFCQCEYLEEVDFAGEVDCAKVEAFSNCLRLKSFGNLTKITELKARAVYWSKGIDPAIFKGLEIVGNNAFSGCFSPNTYVEIPYGVKTIYYYSFDNSAVIIPETLENYDPQNAPIIKKAKIKTSKDITVGKNEYQLEGMNTIEQIYVKEVIPTKEINITNNSDHSIIVNEEEVQIGQSVTAKPVDDTIDETRENEENNIEEDLYSGYAGGFTTYEPNKWRYDPETATLYFSGWYITCCEAPHLRKLVKHIVFEEGITTVDTNINEIEHFTPFTEVEDITIPSTMNHYAYQVGQFSKHLKKYIVADNCVCMKEIDGNLYQRANFDPDSKLSLVSYVGAKNEEKFILPEEASDAKEESFIGNLDLKEVVFPEKNQNIKIPFKSGLLERITVLNTDCSFDSLEYKDYCNQMVCAYSYTKTENACKSKNIKYKSIEIENIKEISIVKNPDNLEYYVGSRFDPSGMEIKAITNDGEEIIATYGFTVNCSMNKLGKETVEVCYGDQKALLEINVVEIPEDLILGYRGYSTEIEANQIKYIYFTPKVSGEYMLSSHNNYSYHFLNMDDTYLYLYSNTKCYLEKDKTYKIKLTGDSGLKKPTRIYVNLSAVQGDNICAEGEHVYKEVQYDPPTCTEEGVTYYICEICLKKDRYITDPALGHVITKADSTIESTCSTKGYDIGVCDRCGETGRGAYKPLKQHDYYYTVVEPTMYDYGYTVLRCKNCIFVYSYSNWTDPLIKTQILEDLKKKNNSSSGQNNIDVEKLDDTNVKKVDKKDLKVSLSKKKASGKTTIYIKNWNKKFLYQVKVYKNKKQVLSLTTDSKKIKTNKKGITNVKVRAFYYKNKKRICGKYSKLKI